MTYVIRVAEEGLRLKEMQRMFTSLKDVQTYVRERWEGPDYIDGEASWHNDYCTFELEGATLADLGARKGPWEWEWKDLG